MGTQKNDPGGALQNPIVPVKLLDANVGENKPLPANGHIELAFDRLLQPASVTRQTFVLENAGGTEGFTPAVAYDPVARVVTITPLTDSTQALKANQSYRVIITTPHDASDPNGLRAIDGATLDPRAAKSIFFTVTDPLPTPPAAPRIDYCRDIDVIFANKCSQQICHGQPPSAAGLILSPGSEVAMTALGRVAQGANTGPRSVSAPPSRLFGEDMPIIDPGADPSNSWLLYKVLLAAPTPEMVVENDGGADAGVEDATTVESGAIEASVPDGSGTDAAGGDSGVTDAGVMDAGVADGAGGDGGDGGGGVVTVGPKPPVDVSHVHELPWQGISTSERAALSNYVLGREMPFPTSATPLTVSEMERISLWIAQGSATPASCPP